MAIQAVMYVCVRGAWAVQCAIAAVETAIWACWWTTWGPCIRWRSCW